MTAILGISAYYHDSAAAIVVDGDIVAAAQEERFTRKKHDHRFPRHAVDYCLKEAGVDTKTIDAVVFYDKPLLKFERLLETYLAFAPSGFGSFSRAMPLWLRQKLHIPREIDNELGDEYDGPIYFTTHHESHAASAFYPSPFDEAAIIVADGVGEWATTSWGVGKGSSIQLKQEIRFPHSIGLLYSAFTYYAGFKVNSGEYKLMGLAPYGKPKFVDLILQNLVNLKEDGSIWLDQRYFNYCAGLTMTSRRFHKLFGSPPRNPESPLTQHYTDVAASVQVVVETILLKIVQHVHAQTGIKQLCMAGGVALNCVANGRILREGPFENVWIQPAAGDAGGALGATLTAWHQIMGNARTPVQADIQKGSYLGPSYSQAEIEETLKELGATYHHYPEEDLHERVAELLADNKVVGHFAGRMEFGPRALGARSILGNPQDPGMQSKMNLKIKFRESFRPFAPSVIANRSGEYFELDGESPYMLLVAKVRSASGTDGDVPESTHGTTPTGTEVLERLRRVRSDIPSVTHVDGSARVQTVSALKSPRFHALLEAFERRSGCGVLINTSFNVRGEPIVNTPRDAYRCFVGTNMDALVLENALLLRQEQPQGGELKPYHDSFTLD